MGTYIANIYINIHICKHTFASASVLLVQRKRAGGAAESSRVLSFSIVHYARKNRRICDNGHERACAGTSGAAPAAPRGTGRPHAETNLMLIIVQLRSLFDLSEADSIRV